MATFLLTWELGGGTGHCVNLRPIAEHLCRRGHRGYVALRDVSVAHRVFGDLGVAILQAPYAPKRPRQPVHQPCTFAKPFRWTYTGRPVTAETIKRPITWKES